ncbi:MerR family transcriptional regulator [Paenibacillus sp. LHD-117]|uniref:MerR family transcriptional regulator n=1 Tax=Paenibacillus sp. LHD-117 TaxID=3071412 RepID=UPI0035A83444
MTGLSKETLRYYEEIKLLEPVRIDPKNKYRYYDNHSYLIARILVHLRMFQFTIQEMLAAVHEKSFEQLESTLLEKRSGLEKEIARLQGIVNSIDEFMAVGYEEADKT